MNGRFHTGRGAGGASWGAGKRAPKSPQEMRHAWNAAILLAGSLGRAALAPEAGVDPAIGGEIYRLRAMANDLDAQAFPVDAVSARAMASAFLLIAKTWAHPATGPEARTACAGFLLAGAGCLDGLLAQLRTHEADAWRGRYGRDED